ncbi:MAG: hypothetical protein ABIM74_01660 [candidate division WOR-3 bacterium]
MKSSLWVMLGLIVVGCGGPKTQTQADTGHTGPKLTPAIEGAAWVNKMPGPYEKDSLGQPIYPGRFLLKVYGDAEVIKLSISAKEREIGEFTSEGLIKKKAERWVEYLVQRNLRITESDTLSVRVWMVVGKDTTESLLPSVPVRAVY